jgi:hypothetical protein
MHLHIPRNSNHLHVLFQTIRMFFLPETQIIRFHVARSLQFTCARQVEANQHDSNSCNLPWKEDAQNSVYSVLFFTDFVETGLSALVCFHQFWMRLGLRAHFPSLLLSVFASRALDCKGKECVVKRCGGERKKVAGKQAGNREAHAGIRADPAT